MEYKLQTDFITTLVFQMNFLFSIVGNKQSRNNAIKTTFYLVYNFPFEHK